MFAALLALASIGATGNESPEPPRAPTVSGSSTVRLLPPLVVRSDGQVEGATRQMSVRRWTEADGRQVMLHLVEME